MIGNVILLRGGGFRPKKSIAETEKNTTTSWPSLVEIKEINLSRLNLLTMLRK